MRGSSCIDRQPNQGLPWAQRLRRGEDPTILMPPFSFDAIMAPLGAERFYESKRDRAG
jgi:hypothetical protein